MTTRFLSTIAALAASVTLGANLISSGSAQAAIFDFEAKWDNNTTTKGWFEVDDTPEEQVSNPSLSYRRWLSNSVLDADFTHQETPDEETRYDESDLTYLNLYNFHFLDSSYRLDYGNEHNFLNLRFNNQEFTLSDYGVDGSTHSVSDYGHKNGRFGSAKSLSLVERSAKAVPEPTTMAGLAVVGLGLLARRKQARASVTV